MDAMNDRNGEVNSSCRANGHQGRGSWKKSGTSRWRGPRLLLALLLLLSAGVVTVPSIERASASPGPLALPFACGTTVAASTYAGHGQAVDFYRAGAAYNQTYGMGLFAPADANIWFKNPDRNDGAGDVVAILEFRDGSGREMRVRHLRPAGIPARFKGVNPQRSVVAGEKFGEAGWNGFLDPKSISNSHAHVELYSNDQPVPVDFQGATIAAQYGGASATNPHQYTSKNCRSDAFAEGVRGRLVEVTTGAAYVVSSDGIARHVPTADSFWCVVDSGMPRVPVKVDPTTFSSAGLRIGPSWPDCISLPRYNGFLFRQSNGAAFVVEGQSLRPITDGFTFDCLRDRGLRFRDQISPALLDPKPRGAAMPVCLSPSRSNNTIFELPDGTSYYVAGDGKAHWIPDWPTWKCRVNGGARIAQATRAHIQSLGAEGGWDDCFDRSIFIDSVTRHVDGDAHYVNGSGHGRWIPDQATWDCRTRGQGKRLIEVRRRNYIDALNAASGGAWDYCFDLNQLKGRILRHNDGDAHYIDGSGIRHWIPSGATYNCLVSRGVQVVGTRWREYVNNIREGSWATC